MYLSSVFGFSCIILSVTCAPQRFWSSGDVEDSPRPYWLNSRRSAYPPMSMYGSFGDDMTRMLDELQKSLLEARVRPQFTSQSHIPVFSVSTSSSDESDDSEEAAGPSVSISGSGFGSLFSHFGGFDPKSLKNKTTVKTEVIDGHKVTVKESTYVSDQDGIQSVIHLSEVDLADSAESDEKTFDKPSTPKPSEDESPEDKDEKESEDKEEKDKKSEDKPKKEASPEDDEPKAESTPEDDKPKAESTPEDDKPKAESTPEDDKPKAESTPKDDKPKADAEENNETDSMNSEENHVRTNRHPDSEVEEIETDGDNYYNYKYNKVGKIKEVGKKKLA